MGVRGGGCSKVMVLYIWFSYFDEIVIKYLLEFGFGFGVRNKNKIVFVI